MAKAPDKAASLCVVMESGLHFIRRPCSTSLQHAWETLPPISSAGSSGTCQALLLPRPHLYRGNETRISCTGEEQTRPHTRHACRQDAVVALWLACDRNKSLANTPRHTIFFFFFFSFRAKPIMSRRCKKPNVCLNFIKKVNNCICDSPGRLIVSPLVN